MSGELRSLTVAFTVDTNKAEPDEVTDRLEECVEVAVHEFYKANRESLRCEPMVY